MRQLKILPCLHYEMTQEKQQTLNEDAEEAPTKAPRAMDDRLSAITRMTSEISDRLSEVMERVDEIHDMLSENQRQAHYGSDYELTESDE